MVAKPGHRLGGRTCLDRTYSREETNMHVCVIVGNMVASKQPQDGGIRKRVFIQASAATIYRALTDAKALSLWFCDKATSDPRVDGELTAYWRAGKTGRRGLAVYRQLTPDLLVDLLWVDDGSGADPARASHRLVYTIMQKKSACEVVVEDRDSAPSDDETYGILDEGWNAVLSELKDYCESAERSLKIPHGR
jgi:uncharacterized protein YndB with AHSA1/START domain